MANCRYMQEQAFPRLQIFLNFLVQLLSEPFKLSKTIIREPGLTKT